MTTQEWDAAMRTREAWLDAAWEVLGKPEVMRRLVVSPVHLLDPAVMHARAAAWVRSIEWRFHAAGVQCWWHHVAPCSSGKSCWLEVWVWREKPAGRGEGTEK